jgi:hypothetical protein
MAPGREAVLPAFRFMPMESWGLWTSKTCAWPSVYEGFAATGQAPSLAALVERCAASRSEVVQGLRELGRRRLLAVKDEHAADDDRQEREGADGASVLGRPLGLLGDGLPHALVGWLGLGQVNPA